MREALVLELYFAGRVVSSSPSSACLRLLRNARPCCTLLDWQNISGRPLSHVGLGNADSDRHHADEEYEGDCSPSDQGDVLQAENTRILLRLLFFLGKGSLNERVLLDRWRFIDDNFLIWLLLLIQGN